MDTETSFSVGKPAEGQPWDVAIIGSGPAGLTAAIYTTRGAASTVILGGEKWGGQLMLTTTVDNYPALPSIQGPDLMAKMKDHATKFGAEFVAKNVESISSSDDSFSLIAGGTDYRAKSIIIAAGSDTRWLGIPGEEQFRGKGVSSCAPCDAPFFKGKTVAVVGGGDSAFEETGVLAKYATKTILVHRRDEFKASKIMQEKVERKENVEIFHCTEVLEVKGQQVVESLSMKSWKGSKHHESIEKRITTQYGGIKSQDDEFLYWELPVQGMFVAIGHIPSTNMFKGVVELDTKGYVVKHDRMGFSTATSQEGIFVAGDVHDWHYMQAVTAAGFGCMAALDVEKWLGEYEVDRNKEASKSLGTMSIS